MGSGRRPEEKSGYDNETTSGLAFRGLFQKARPAVSLSFFI